MAENPCGNLTVQSGWLVSSFQHVLLTFRSRLLKMKSLAWQSVAFGQKRQTFVLWETCAGLDGKKSEAEHGPLDSTGASFSASTVERRQQPLQSVIVISVFNLFVSLFGYDGSLSQEGTLNPDVLPHGCQECPHSRNNRQNTSSLRNLEKKNISGDC